MKSQVNILLPDLSYSSPRNKAGVRHHLYDLYTSVFHGQDTRVYPTEKVQNILYSAIRDLFRVRSGSLNVVTQGYSVLTVYAAALLWKDIRIIVHTWKVPGFSDKRITASVYDYLLDKVINKSMMVVVASKKQERQIRLLYPDVQTFFAPVTVDTKFWSPGEDTTRLLSRYGLKENNYILTVGGNDRNEEICMKVAERLGVPYIRVTKNQPVIDHVKAVEKALNKPGITTILSNISDTDLIALYHNAFVVLLPTITRTNPAGLSSLVEALSCASVVVVENDLAEGYVIDGENGMVLTDLNVDSIVERIKDIGDVMRTNLKTKARDYAVNTLTSDLVASRLHKLLKSCK